MKEENLLFMYQDLIRITKKEKGWLIIGTRLY